MILRPFSLNDVPVLARYQFPAFSEEEIQCILGQWNTKSHQNRYFEMLAVEENGLVVGNVSLFEYAPGFVSEGVEIYPPYRQQGYGFAAVTALLFRAAALGYQVVLARIRQDNRPSLALHQKLGFQITKEDVTSRGQPVYELSKSMEVNSNGIQKHHHHPKD